MAPRPLAIPFEGVPGGELGALLDEPPARGARLAVLLAHGAGAGMDTPLLNDVAAALAARGMPVLRFRYPYMQRAAIEGGRRPPDPRAALERAHRAALEHLRRLAPQAAVVLGGKSLGGRIASLIAAAGEDCAGLFFLGYPLHPAGAPERLRSAHFPDLRAPALFLEGTRDPLCDLDLLRRELAKLPRAPDVVVIEGADHGFALPRSAGRSPAEVHAELAAAIARWAETL